MSRPPLPPFTRETAAQKARMAEDAWNSCDPERVALAYTEDSHWRNRSEFFQGRPAIVAFLTGKWSREHEYRLIKDLWAFDGNRIAVRFQYEWHDDAGQWWRSYGNENWEFDEHGLMRRREASINDLAIAASDRRIHGSRPPGDQSSLPLRCAPAGMRGSSGVRIWCSSTLTVQKGQPGREAAMDGDARMDARLPARDVAWRRTLLR